MIWSNVLKPVEGVAMPHCSKARPSLYALMAFVLVFVMAFAMMPTKSRAEEGAVEIGTVDKESQSVIEGPTAKEEAQSMVESPSVGTSQTDEAPVAKPEEGSQVEAAEARQDTPESSEEIQPQAVVEAAPSEEERLGSQSSPTSVSYSAHMQSAGWMDYVKDGETAGITGRSLRMEGLKVELSKGDEALAGGIEYRMHVQGSGWLGWCRDGAVGGIVGRRLRMEALQVRLYGEMAERYHVYYTVHVQGIGWMSWAADGESAGTAGQSRRIEAIKIRLVKDGEDPALDTSFVNYGVAFDKGQVISVQAHVQSIGWQDPVGNGSIAGTTGRGLRVEALRVKATGLDVPGSILVDGHVQGRGWTGYVGEEVGTTGQGKRLEAVRMVLTGDEAEAKYDLYYRVHVAHIGWLAWAHDGEEAGTAGMGAPVEAVQVVVVSKGDVPSSSSSVTDERFITGTSLFYKAHCQSYGWLGEVADGGVAGTTGQKKRLEAYTARLDGGTIGGGIRYRAYVAGSGWQGYVADNDTAGTVGLARGVEAIQVILTGRAAQMYNVYYRTHVSGAGWLGWAKDGQTAGAPATGHNVEAIQIRLVSKSNPSPGSSNNREVDKVFFEDPMVRRAQGYYSPTGWIILVDTDKCQLAVCRGSMGNWRLYDKWVVSCGAPGSPTVRGVYEVDGRGYVFGHGYSCYYWVSWNGPYLFHSIKYNEGTFDVQDGRLGEHVSAGCVRMPLDRAKFIYDTIPDGTTVVTY